ncbi:MAG: Cof-type HAD-IIB family hydrolase [Limnochordia bacterium]|jgi:Cof subfamily protein (haloacid dehalogenase superfamily)
MIRLVAIDMDDTLLTDELTIDPRCAAAIAKAREKGVLVTIATGRMYRSALPYAQQLQIDVPLVCYNGAMIRQVSGKLLHHDPVPEDTVAQLIPFCAERNLTLQLYVEEELVVEEINPHVEYYISVANVPAKAVGTLKPAPSTKALIVGNEVDLDTWEPKIQELFGHQLEATRSKPRYIEMTKKGVSKAVALRFLAEHYGIDRREIMAIGDSFNDLEMIKYAGIGVAMANAPQEVKEVADYVTRSNGEAGVAYALDCFLAC